MFLNRLLSSRRYQRCVQLFRRPLWAHLQISAALPAPLSLDINNGDRLDVSSARGCRRMFHLLLEQLPDPFPVRVADGLVEFQHEGRTYALRPTYGDFYIFKEVIFRDDYRLNALPEPLGTVVDLGMNIGLFTTKMAAAAERVIGLEPVQENFEMANRALVRAGLDHKVTCLKAAIAGNSSGTVRIYSSDNNGGGHSMFRDHAAQWGNTRYEDVPVINLSDLFVQQGIERCSLVKCDIEGAEFELIANTPLEVLSSIDRILMEVHLNVIDWDRQRFGDFTARMTAAGFQVEHDSLVGRWGRRRRGIVLWATNERAAATRRAA